jgi:regulator of CtrA degradation
MRLTTRLMQVASWLLVQRAVREGDMEPEAACEDRYRLAGEEGRAAEEAGHEDMPPGLMLLLDRAEKLYERVRHLDRRMYVDANQEAAPSPVLTQLDRLKTALGGF